MEVVDAFEWACVLCGHCIQNDGASRLRICIKFCIKLEHSSMIQKATAMGNWWLAVSSHQHTCSCITSLQSYLVKHQITQVTQPHYCPAAVPSKFWLFPKLKSPLKGKRVQTVDETQENTTGQLMAIARTVWGPKVTTLKGTKASLSNVQCFLYLVPSSINVYFSYYMAGYFLERLLPIETNHMSSSVSGFLQPLQ